MSETERRDLQLKFEMVSALSFNFYIFQIKTALVYDSKPP